MTIIAAIAHASRRRLKKSSPRSRRDTIATLTPPTIEIVDLFPPSVSRVMGRAAPHKRGWSRLANATNEIVRLVGAPPTLRWASWGMNAITRTPPGGPRSCFVRRDFLLGPTLPQNVSSGGKVTTRHTEPPGGGSIVCGRNIVSWYSPITGGEESATQMRAEENPGRAGSARTSGDGPSITATDFPSLSSMVTTRRTDFISSLIFNPGFSVDFRTSRPS